MISLKKLLVRLSCPYAINDIYITTNIIDPNIKWPWTQWVQLTDDTYFKITTDNFGNIDGTSSEHKIPINSMPSHTHDQYVSANSGSYPRLDYVADGAFDRYYQCESGPAGEGQAYYPYYYGVYAWKRVA